MARAKKAIGSWDEEWVTVDVIDCDPSFNRPVDERRCQEMAADFNADRFGTPYLSHRDDGRYVTLDGQHRLTCLRLMGWNGAQIRANTKSGLTRAQEAEWVIFLNEGRKGLRFVDRFLARIQAHDSVAVQIAKVVQDAGYVVDRVSRDGVITAPQALEDVYLGRGQRIKGLNPKALRKTLACLTDAWGRTSNAVGAQVIKGVGAFFLRYGDMADPARVTQKLSRIAGGPGGLVLRGKGKRELHGGTIASGVAHYLTDEYNKGVRGRNRLPGWRESAED